MTKLIWGTAGARVFEAGVDRGVLYLSGLPGVSWNGLTSVNEAPKGGEPKPYYIDGFKYANVSATEEFNATIEAFSSPSEFSVCDGNLRLAAGLFVTQQPRKSFGLSYRTLVGDDLSGLDNGYKIHLVYNVLASPSGRQNTSTSDTVEPMGLSWDITTRPSRGAIGYKPTSHLVIDSRTTPRSLLVQVENILYGSATVQPELPTQSYLVNLFESYVPLEITLYTNGSYAAQGSAVTTSTAGTGIFIIDHESVIDNGDGSFTIL